MAKTVKKLKNKHTGDVWVDADGDVWYFNVDDEQWYVISAFDPDSPSFVLVADASPNVNFGPYRKLNRFK